jgi:hypothetical protein
MIEASQKMIGGTKQSSGKQSFQTAEKFEYVVLTLVSYQCFYNNIRGFFHVPYNLSRSSI